MKRAEMTEEVRAKRRAQNVAWNERNKEVTRAAVRRYRLKNVGNWSEAHIIKRRKRIKSYYEKNKGKYLAWCHARRARIAQSGGSFTPAQIAALYDKQDANCAACWSLLFCGYEIDHIVPVSKGGSSDISNIQLLCMSCNRSKHNKDNRTFLSSVFASGLG